MGETHGGIKGEKINMLHEKDKENFHLHFMISREYSVRHVLSQH